MCVCVYTHICVRVCVYVCEKKESRRERTMQGKEDSGVKSFYVRTTSTFLLYPLFHNSVIKQY